MKLKPILILVVALLVGSLFVGAAAAQETTQVPDTQETNTTYALQIPGDSQTRIVEFSYEDNSMTLLVEADVPTPLTLTAAPEMSGDSSAGVGYAESTVVPAGRTEVTVRSPNGVVWISTRESLQNGKFGYVRASTSSFPIPGPWDAADARNAGIGSALSVGLVTVVLAWKRRFATSPGGERIA